MSGEAFTGDVRDGNVLMFDDLIASGTTIFRAAQAARRAGARRIDVIATHAAFLPTAMQLFDEGGPDGVMVSDSIALPDAFQPLLRLFGKNAPILAVIRKRDGYWIFIVLPLQIDITPTHNLDWQRRACDP